MSSNIANRMEPEKNIISYLKHYGFFLPSAEIYGGLAHVWDWGPLGGRGKDK